MGSVGNKPIETSGSDNDYKAKLQRDLKQGIRNIDELDEYELSLLNDVNINAQEPINYSIDALDIQEIESVLQVVDTDLAKTVPIEQLEEHQMVLQDMLDNPSVSAIHKFRIRGLMEKVTKKLNKLNWDEQF